MKRAGKRTKEKPSMKTKCNKSRRRSTNRAKKMLNSQNGKKRQRPLTVNGQYCSSSAAAATAEAAVVVAAAEREYDWDSYSFQRAARR